MLGSMLGEAVPKATPSDVISGLKTGLYKDWQTTDGDKRCPICLDDYAPTDTVTKLNDCPHWLHKECLEQWLKSASTCPVCRKAVKGASTLSSTTTPAPRNRRQLLSRAHTHVHDLGNTGPDPHRRPGPEEDDEESTFGRRFYF
ncbi:hypothetical protein CPB85DRAFT_1272039 [Mucidula mucida]|nr:hypothetical protein CPB85DRAFT_1272039 [Mucidula mucida]